MHFERNQFRARQLRQVHSRMGHVSELAELLAAEVQHPDVSGRSRPGIVITSNLSSREKVSPPAISAGSLGPSTT